MNSWKLLLFQLLIFGLMTSGFSKPTEDSDDGFMNDGDADDYDDDSSDQVVPNQKQSNSVDLSAPKAYFKLTDYTENVKAGEQVTLKCDVGNANVRTVVLWYKDDPRHMIYQSKIRVVTDDRFILLPDYSLVISHVQEHDQGLYHCNVQPDNITMKAKLVIMSPLQAHIYEGGREITDRSITYRENERIEIECKASGFGSNKINFKWSADGNRLNSNDNLEIDGGRLVINKANHDNVRVYQCLADDGDDGTSHATVTINIQYTPRVSVRKSVVNTRMNDDAELYCDFETSTESRVIWYKDGKQLPISTTQEPRSKYSVAYGQPKGSKNHSILVLNKVNQMDLGQYECKVENQIGSESVNIKLTFDPEPPHLQKIEKDGEFIITHWHIRSLQQLTEVMLKYRQKDEKEWKEDVPIDTEQSKEHFGLWKIRHRIALAPGHWHAHVKAKNTEGWSEYSNIEDFIVNAPTGGATNLVTFPMSCIILTTVYSINFLTKLFG